MKKQFILKTGAFSCLVMLLTACSGGGSGEKNFTIPVTTPDEPRKPQAKQPSTAKKEKSEQASSTPSEKRIEPVVTAPNPNQYPLRELPRGEIKNEDVGFGSITGYQRRYSFNGAWIEPEAPSEIVVDQVKLSISRSLSVGGLKGIFLANTLERLWNASFKNPDRKIFYFGEETPLSAMEQLKGKVRYLGNATRYDNVSGELRNIGTSSLLADFDSKTISGDLKIDGLWRRNISLKPADIRGNQFIGKAVVGEGHILRNVEGMYEGSFFGPNAEEVAGKATFTGEAIIGNGLRDLDTSFSAEQESRHKP